MKICSKCKKSKENGEFHKTKASKDGLQYICKECTSKYKRSTKAFDYTIYTLTNNVYGKACNKCDTLKELSEFGKCRLRKDGFNNTCKKCSAIYNRKYRKENKAKISEHGKMVRKRDKDKISAGLRVRNGSTTGSLYVFNQILKVDDPKMIDGVITVICKHCGKRFSPKLVHIRVRIRATNGVSGGEANFYCSDGCKKDCPIYRRSRHRKGEEPTSRPRTTGERYAIKAAKKRDGHRCITCGNIKRLQGHHLIPHKLLIGTSDEYLISDTDNIITLCKDCHWDVHRDDYDISNACLRNKETRESACHTN